MKKFLLFIPAIFFAVLSVFSMFAGGVTVSPMVFIWIGLFICGGIMLNRDQVYGAILGLIPALHLMVMGTKETGQIINEIPIGIVIAIYYCVCGFVIYKKNKIRE